MKGKRPRDPKTVSAFRLTTVISAPDAFRFQENCIRREGNYIRRKANVICDKRMFFCDECSSLRRKTTFACDEGAFVCNKRTFVCDEGTLFVVHVDPATLQGAHPGRTR